MPITFHLQTAAYISFPTNAERSSVVFFSFFFMNRLFRFLLCVLSTPWCGTEKKPNILKAKQLISHTKWESDKDSPFFFLITGSIHSTSSIFCFLSYYHG